VVVERAVESGNFDTIMPSVNFMQSPAPRLSRSLRTADAKGVGITAMKVLANVNRMQASPIPGRPLSHAAIGWTLNQPGVNNLVITIDSWQKLDEYLRASAFDLAFMDKIRLVRHSAATSWEYCRAGCGQCSGTCPNGVDVGTVLRIDQYRSCYQQEDMALEQYLAFSGHNRVEACLHCQDPVCQAACPFGLPLRSRLRLAHRCLDPNGVVPS